MPVVTTKLVGNLPFLPVYNVKDYGAYGDGVHDDTAAWQATEAVAAASGGVAYGPAGTYYCTSAIAVHSNVTIAGAGTGATFFTVPSTFTGDLFYIQTIDATNGLHDIRLTGFTLTGPGGTPTAGSGIHWVTYTNAAIPIKRIFFDHLYFTGWYRGLHIEASNTSAGWLNNDMTAAFNVYTNNQIGSSPGGTWNFMSLRENFMGNALVGLATPGMFNNPLDNSGPPAALMKIVDAIVVGTGPSPLTSGGIGVAGSQLIMNNCFAGYCQYAFSIYTTEGFGSLLNALSTQNTEIAIFLSSDSMNGGVLSNFTISGSSSQSIQHLTGDWEIGPGHIPSDLPAPASWGITVGVGGNNQYRRVALHDITWPFGSTPPFVYIANSQNGLLTVHDCPGYNPAGSSVPGTAFALPASGTAWTNNTGVDGTLYVTGAGVVTDVVVQDVTVGSSLTVGEQFFVPAGGTITFTYTTAPTLVFVGN